MPAAVRVIPSQVTWAAAVAAGDIPAVPPQDSPKIGATSRASPQAAASGRATAATAAASTSQLLSLPPCGPCQCGSRSPQPHTFSSCASGRGSDVGLSQLILELGHWRHWQCVLLPLHCTANGTGTQAATGSGTATATGSWRPGAGACTVTFRLALALLLEGAHCDTANTGIHCHPTARATGNATGSLHAARRGHPSRRRQRRAAGLGPGPGPPALCQLSESCQWHCHRQWHNTHWHY